MPIGELSPSSKSTPKSSVKQLDLTLLDTAPVREKIKQWQTAGGGVQLKEDKSKIAEAFKKEIEQVRAASSSHTRSQSAGLQVQIVEPPATPAKGEAEERTPATDPVKPRAVERRPKPNRLDSDLKKASAPKKRVVSDGHWVRKHEEPEENEPDVQGAWVRKHITPEEKKPEPQFGWIRDPLLPRDPPQPPSPPKPKDVKVYAARPRKKSFASPEHSGNSSDDVRKPPSPVRKTTTPKKASPAKAANVVEVSPQKAPREHISGWARNIGPPSESVMADMDADERAHPTHRSSRNRRAAEAPSYYKETPPSPEAHRKSTSDRQPSSPEASAKPTLRSRIRKSADELKERPSSSRGRSSLQQSPEQIEADEFTRYRKSSHRRGKSVGAPLTDRRREHHYDEAEEAYVHAERRGASYREEFEKYAPTEKYSPPDRRTSTYRKSRMAEQYEDRVPDEMDAPVEPLPPGMFGSRVEAWLCGTPDPFTDAGSEAPKSKRSFSYEEKGTHRSPSTLDTASRQLDHFDMSRSAARSSRISSRCLRVDTNTARTNHDRQRAVSPEQSDVTMDQDAIEVEYSSATSVPSSLKRRGATRNSPTPTKERNESLSLADSNVQSEVASSAVSSSVDASKFVPPDAPARHSANAAGRRVPFASKRLSTIVSVDTLNTKAQQAPSVTEIGSGASEGTARPLQDGDGSDTITKLTAYDDPSVVSTATKSRTSLKRKLTKHSDLISVLSIDAPSKSKSIISARSIRTHRSRLETATISDLMKEVASDEAKYMRELKTLADGVIMVLLKCVLSKSDAALAAGLYSKAPSNNDVTNATNLIRELGVSLNRLKTLHARIPTEEADKFLNWAQSAHKIYADYVKTWRMGFEDVVVSLSTNDDGKSNISETKSVHGASWDDGLPRNEDGYVIDGDGVRVDVAFLLKRPLVRLKYLSKTVKGINFLKPSTKAGALQKTFEELMASAKKRVNEEKARMEDDSAANIDASRTRDLKSLAPIAGVKIEREKCVRARDYFDLHLDHTSGQMVDCRVELLLRDAPGGGNKGDLLVCEVDNTSRWLFLPPVALDRLSARKGDAVGEIVVMVRGLSLDGTEWQELLTLYNLDEDVAYEWIQMLGTEPVPPKVQELKSAKSTPMERPASSYISSSYLSERTTSTVPQKSRTPSPREIDIPIGEKAGSRSKRWTYSSPEPEYAYEKQQTSPVTPPTSESAYGVRLKKPEPKKSPELEKSAPSRWSTFKGKFTSRKDDPPHPSLSPRTDGDRTPRDLNEAMDLAGSGPLGLRRTKATRYRSTPKGFPTVDSPPLRGGGEDFNLPAPTESEQSTGSRKKPSHRPKEELKRVNTTKSGFSVWMPPSRTGSDEDSEDEGVSSHFSATSTRPVLSQRPNFERRASVPSSDAPTVSKLRNGSLPTTPTAPATPPKDALQLHKERAPVSAPSKLQKKPPVEFIVPPKTPEEDRPPPPPPHRTPSSTQTPTKSSQHIPQFTPTPQLKRRSSSPLKHEYQPSSASSSDPDSESASDYSDDDSLTSESEDDLDDEDDALSYLGPSLIPKSKPPPPPAHMSSHRLYSIPETTIKPSDSASQLHAQQPYRQAPQPTPSGPTTKMIASIFAWSDTGGWQQLHPDECSIVISPGLISAYEMTAAHNSNSANTLRPLVALELTPHVVTRRGTGLDVSIRSPVTSNSQLRVPSGNVMFRSRSPEECETLYHYMWQAKLNNPTYIALENARPKPTQGMWSEAMDRRASGGEDPDGKKWYHFSESKSKSYRASTRATSTSGNTDSSVRTISSVMNAMKRFSGLQAGSRIFSNSFGGGRDKTSSGSSDDKDGSRTPPSFVSGGGPEGLGITNAKIRLYVRETRGKWADLGTARLSVLQKRERNPETESEAGVDAPIALRTGLEKRILVNSKGGGQVMLDATLGESCFERVARTGIAVSVWEDVADGGVAARGGVAEKRVRIYMIQLKSERECAYTFSLLGKLRY